MESINFHLIRNIDILKDFTQQNSTVTRLESLTNQVFKIENDQHQKLIYRIYNDDFDLIINRRYENSFTSFYEKPVIYFSNDKLRIEQYIEHQELQLDNDAFFKEVAKSIAPFHLIQETQFWVDQQQCCLDKFLDDKKFQEIIENIENGEYKKKDQIIQNLKFFTQDDIKSKLQSLKKQLNKTNSIKFCHNDLNVGNMLQTQQNQSIQLIDFEYCGKNYRGFEFGNFFNELASQYQPYFSIDLNKLPNVYTRQNFFLQYLYYQKHQKLPNSIQTKNFLNNKEVIQDLESLEQESKIGMIFSSYFWCLIAALSYNLDIDLDIIQYIEARIEHIKLLIKLYDSKQL